MPIFGFNTDVKVGNTDLHVQTEDRGTGNPVLDTTIYLGGRVLAKRCTSYQDFLASPDFTEAELHAMLEQQHKQIIEEVRSGKLAELADVELEPVISGISVQLLNPATFLKATTASLEVAVSKRQDAAPVPAASIRVLLHTGMPRPFQFETKADQTGKATLQFHMPRLGPGGAELVIQAVAPEGQDEIKYNVRPRSRMDA